MQPLHHREIHGGSYWIFLIAVDCGTMNRVEEQSLKDS